MPRPSLSKTKATLIALGVVALLVMGFFLIFRSQGNFRLKALGVEVSAEGRNPPPPALVAPGVKTGNIKSGADVDLRSTSSGGVESGVIDAAGKVTAEHTPSPSPPKS